VELIWLQKASPKMEFERMGIEGAWITHSPLLKDQRGNLREWFQRSECVVETGIDFNVRHSVVSKSKKGVVRGIHYNLHPTSQFKWLTCVSGSIYDVVVDIRQDSPTFKAFKAVNLTEENGLGVLIHGELGHSFQAQTETALVVYNLSLEYSPEHDFGINPLDDEIGIDWPIKNRIISAKDLSAPTLSIRKSNLQLPFLTD
jgi:dTDP-4-dehydrorhamnose 3,5-epimerase